MAETQTELKSDPFYIDINIVTSLGFQKQLTDYIDLLSVFPDEVAVNHTYWHTDSHSDPYTSKIEFFKRLNNSTHNLKNSSTGNISDKATEELLFNKNIRDQLPINVHLETDAGSYGTPAITGKTTKAIKKEYNKKWISVTEGQEHENSLGTMSIENLEPEITDIEVMDRTDLQRSPTTLKEEFGMKEMSPSFVLWWIEKFRSAHKVVQSGLKEILGDDNEYFVNFSESVGQLKNTGDTYDVSTIPLYDTSLTAAAGEESFPVPATIAGIAQYGIKPETLTLATELTKETNIIYRSNIFSHSDDSSRDVVVNKMAELSTNSHGCNLVNDGEHPKRIMRFIGGIREDIESHLKGLYGVLELLSNRENYMITGKPKQILIKVEDFTQAVDLFKNKIKSFDLDKDDTTLSRYGKGSHYNNQLTTADYLA